MLSKIIKLIIILILFYQTPTYSKSTSFKNFNSKNLSKYFSGIVAFENKDIKGALNFFNSSKILLNEHDVFLKKYVYSLVLENKTSQAINIVKQKKNEKTSNFFDANLLLIIDSLKKNNFDKAYDYSLNASKNAQNNKFNLAIIEIIKQYISVFKNKKISDSPKKFGKLSIISEVFQKCYLEDSNTDKYFSNLINDVEGDYSRYNYFYISFLIQADRFIDAKKITNNINYINSPLLLSQAKNWIEDEKIEKFASVFSCKNANDIISEFLFLISNLYSSQNNFDKSNYYLNLSYFLNPKFLFNLSLIAENQYSNKEFKKAKKTLANFKKEDNFYYWYRLKKEAEIIAKEKNKEDSLNYLASEFKKIEKPTNKELLDMGNFYKNSKKYKEAIIYYTKIIDVLNENSEVKKDLFYRRGGSYERIGLFDKADKDLLDSLKINPEDPYVLNYLAYSWLERNYKINEAIKMLEKAHSLKKNDPYILDSVGWAYYLTNDVLKAEKFLKKAVELMPNDPIVNDHYADILWKLNRKIQARYFWRNVLKMDDTEEDMKKKINIKIIEGPKSS